MDEYDRLVEQQDQEMIRNGFVSPFTLRQIQAYEAGESVPHVRMSPEVQRLTAQLLRRLKGQPVEKDDEQFDAYWCGDNGNW